ncbi:small ribosomal subunit protein bS18m [Planococcus citri]|uniref:small ribosomal subunit protein bS18m n=1 Tax=Planococcus citri TaxID=170843 RepID=UPI0031F892C4
MFQFAGIRSRFGLTLHLIKFNISKPDLRTFSNSAKLYSSSDVKQLDYNNLKPDNSSIIHYERRNMPEEMENPYVKEKELCVLCKHKITPDFKNTRLLSQFVSRFTGRLYGRHITGLCKAQHERLEKEIKKSINSGLFPAYFKDPRYAHDPMLYDPDNPFRPHRH